MKKELNYKVLQNQHTSTLAKKNIIQLTHCVYKMTLKCQKIVAKNTPMGEPPFAKMLLSHS